VDGAWYLAIAPGLLVACFFWLIVTMVGIPVANAGALDARTFCQLAFIVVFAIAIALNVTALIITIAVRAASCNV
jgi:hypothetical protein